MNFAKKYKICRALPLDLLTKNCTNSSLAEIWRKMLFFHVMKKHPVGTVVNFCTNESRFISACLKAALKFSSQVVVPVASHFFDGTSENRDLLEEIYGAFPECLFIEYPFVPDKIPSSIFKAVHPDPFWHCLSRLIGAWNLKDSIETVLFLDADEVADGRAMAEWLDCSDYEQHTALKLANYWYFREPIYQAEKLEDSIVLVQKKALTPDTLLHDKERNAIYDSLPGPKRRMVLGTSGQPLFHHYSWVRTEEEMLKKVRSWSHRNDRNWDELVRREFSGPFQGTDFVHGYSFRTVESLLEAPSRFQAKGKKNVLHLSGREVVDFAKLKKVPFWRRFLQKP